MDQVKTGRLIRTMRTKLGLTQLALAEQLSVSDKAVSKWERGGGAPRYLASPIVITGPRRGHRSPAERRSGGKRYD